MAASVPAWEKRYSRKLLWTDLGVAIVVVFTAQLVTSPYVHDSAIPHLGTRRTVFALVLVGIWLLALAAYDSRNPSVFGTGPGEYKRVINATMMAFGIAAITLVLTAPFTLHREMMMVAFPLGLVLIVVGRWVWRKRLHQQRRRHLNTYRTIVVGEPGHAAHTATQLRANSINGFELVGAVTNSDVSGEILPGIPVLAHYDRLIATVDAHNIDTVIITGSSALSPSQLKQIGWSLEGRHVDLIVSAALTDVAGPRIHIRPVAGLPLIHVDLPSFSGWKYYTKRILDICLVLLTSVPTAILVAVLAALIRLDSPGPVIFRQPRLGLDGEPFTMFKLRSMRTTAEAELPTLLDQSEGNGALFKLRDDPRVTRVGRFIRRHSLDELPQFVNVLRGEMSLVGPRPPLQREAENYTAAMNRRLLVRPGISGLWQVSGRSDLSWEDSTRLDLFYVENWSITGDLLILWRTLREVFSAKGAY